MDSDIPPEEGAKDDFNGLNNLQKFFQESTVPYTEDELKDIFPALFSTEPLVDIEQKSPIRRDSRSAPLLRVPEPPRVPPGVFNLTQVSMSESGSASALPTIRGAARDQRVEEVKYHLENGPPIDIQPANLLASVARHMKSVNIASKPTLVSTVAGPVSAAIVEAMFWHVHSVFFHPWQTRNQQEVLLDALADHFEEFLLSLTTWKEDIQKYYHYMVAKAVYEGFFIVFPTSREHFQTSFKRRVYEHVLDLFLGPNFAFSFHVAVLRELFGGAEVRDLTRPDKKKSEAEQGSVLFQKPQTPLIGPELRRMTALDEQHEAGALNHAELEDRKRDVLQSREGLRVPVFWNKWTLNKGSSRFEYQEFDPYQICPILARKVPPPLPVGRPSCDTLLYAEPVPTNHPKSFHYNREDIIRKHEEQLKKYEDKKKELDDSITKMEQKIRRQSDHVAMDAAMLLGSKPEIIRQHCDSVVASQAEKERRYKLMQASLAEYKQTLKWDFDLDDPPASVVPLHTVLKPMDWSMMESIRATLAAKGKLSELKHTKKKHVSL